MENIALLSVKVPYSQSASSRPTRKFFPSRHGNNTAVAKDHSSEPTVGIKFLGAGLAACFADMITFPLDTAKVRLQVGSQLMGDLEAWLLLSLWISIVH